MVTKTRWFERAFEFHFPIGVFPCIIERLRGTPARCEELIRSFPPKILTIQINNTWSIQEHVGHLYDLDELHVGRVDDFLSHEKVLRPTDVRNKKTYDAHHNAVPIQTLLRQFREARQHFVHRLELLDEEQAALVAEHPRLRQPMRLVDMAYFVAEHDDHHLARMTELAKLLKKNH